MQFLPAVLLLVAVWLYTATFVPMQSDSGPSELMSVLVFGVGFASFPVIGLYFSLAKTNFLSSLLWTWFCGGILPAAVGQLAFLWFGPLGIGAPGEAAYAKIILSSMLRVFLAVMLGRALQHRLRYRKFNFEKKGA